MGKLTLAVAQGCLNVLTIRWLASLKQAVRGQPSLALMTQLGSGAQSPPQSPTWGRGVGGRDMIIPGGDLWMCFVTLVGNFIFGKGKNYKF